MRKEIIVNLIRGLYAAVKKYNLTKAEKGYIDHIYRVALATEYRISKEESTAQSIGYGIEGAIKANLSGLFTFFCKFSFIYPYIWLYILHLRFYT